LLLLRKRPSVYRFDVYLNTETETCLLFCEVALKMLSIALFTFSMIILRLRNTNQLVLVIRLNVMTVLPSNWNAHAIYE